MPSTPGVRVRSRVRCSWLLCCVLFVAAAAHAQPETPELTRPVNDFDRVPVVLLDGKEHGYWNVDEPRLRRDLGRRDRG